MWIKKIQRKKMQFAIIMLITMVAAAIATACVSFTLETQRYVREYYSVENNPMYYMVLSRDDGRELIEEDPECSKMVSRIEEGKAKYTTDTFYCNNEPMVNGENFIYETNDLDEIGYQVSISEGKEENAPDNGEIWICRVYADAYDVKVGDTIRIGSDEELKVSTIVNSALCSSGFMDMYPFYVNGETFDEIEGTEGYSLMLYAKNDSITVRQLNDAIPDKVYASMMLSTESSTLLMCSALLSGIFGGVGIAAALIISVVSLIVFRYLVRATIATEYQMIGTYKALGMENSEIKKIYLLAYLGSGGLGMIPGILLGRPISVFLSRAVLGGTRLFELTEYTTYTSIGVVIFMSGMLIFNIWNELSKVNNISPVQAMNIHTLSSAEKIGKSVIHNAHSSFSMAVNGLFKKKGMTILTILILATSVYIDLVAGSVSYTLSHYAQDREIWENLPSYDGMIKMYESKQALSYLENSDLVEDYVQAELDPICSGMKIEGTDMSYEEAFPMIYENFTEERYSDVPFTAGRICTEPHEITVSEAFLDDVHKKVGDYLEISVGEKKINFLIAGSYSAMIKAAFPSIYRNVMRMNWGLNIVLIQYYCF